MNNFIIIGFSCHKTFNILSELIKAAEHTKFSHVYVKFYSASLDRWLIYQASGLVVNFVGEEHFLEKNKVIAEFKTAVTPEQKTEVLQLAVDLAGRPYGMKDLIGIGLVRLAALFKKKIKNPFEDGTKAYICSELGATILVKLGVKIEDLDSTTPKDLYDLLRGKDGQD